MDLSQIAAKTMTADDVAAERKAAARSMVLLENDNQTLPLDPAKSVAVIGPLGNNQHDMLGPWWGVGRDTDAVTVYEGIKAQDPNATFVEGCKILDRDPPDPPNDECGSNAGFDDAVAAAQAADQVVLALGETRGESGEAESRSSIDLTGIMSMPSGDEKAGGVDRYASAASTRVPISGRVPPA